MKLKLGTEGHHQYLFIYALIIVYMHYCAGYYVFNTYQTIQINLSLFLQAILFYVPRWLWKNWEAGKIHALMMDLDIGVVQDVEKRQKKRLLLDYLADNLKHHNWWAYRYFFCEFLALVNIIGT